jgi:hypothetical protein
MKSITVTYCFSANYGQFFQCFALQAFLKNFSKNKVLDFNISSSVAYKNFAGNKVKKYIPFLWRVLAFWRKLKMYYKANFSSSSWRKIFLKYIDFTQHFFNYWHILKISLDADIFIAGSDQIWNMSDFHLHHNRIYFLEFIKKSKKISYAASRGKKWDTEDEKFAVRNLKEFSAVSVREQSFADYLNELGIKAVCVCDPAILHNGDFYRNKFSLKNTHACNYIFIYKLGEYMPTFDNRKTITVDLQNEKTLVSVSDWLSLIDKAEFILTDSFHCVVFSLLFHKPFAVFKKNGEWKGMNERFTTLLGKTNLEYRLLKGTETEEQILEIVNRPIDWEQVDAVLEEWRSYSKNWLMEAIK